MSSFTSRADPKPPSRAKPSRSKPSQHMGHALLHRSATGRGRPKYENQGLPTSRARFKDFIKECSNFLSNLKILRKCMNSSWNVTISLCQSMKIKVTLYFQSLSQATNRAKASQSKPSRQIGHVRQACDRAWEAKV